MDAVVAGMRVLGTETAVLSDTIADLGGTDPWFAEVKDGMAIDALRASFVSEIYAAALLEVRGGDGEEALVAAEAILEDARRVVARRHAARWWTGGDAIVGQDVYNPTIYEYGYLARADTLCYWDRERIEVTNLVRGESTPVPPC
jgi:hypothetical protein